MTLFQRVLGGEFDRLPGPVRAVHSLRARTDTSGRANIAAATNPVAWLLCRIAGLPSPGTEVPVSVSFQPREDGTEYWDRRFAQRRYASTMEVGRDGDDGLIIEHFGPFDLLFRLTASREALRWSLVGWRFLGVALPGWSRPCIECRESGEADRFAFDVDVVFPLVGRVVRYGGTLG